MTRWGHRFLPASSRVVPTRIGTWGRLVRTDINFSWSCAHTHRDVGRQKMINKQLRYLLQLAIRERNTKGVLEAVIASCREEASGLAADGERDDCGSSGDDHADVTNLR